MPVQDSSQASQVDQPIDETVEVPEQTTNEVSANEEQQPEPTFTLDQVRKLIREEVNPLIQSQVAKSENRTEKIIQKRLAALEENRAVLNLSDADYAAAQDKIIRDEQMKALKPESPSQGNETRQPANDEDFGRFVTDQIHEVVAAAGVEIAPADPEYKIIQNALSNPNGSIAATIIAAHEAATAKANRVKALKGNAAARTGVGGGQNASSSPYDPNKPASHYLEEAAKKSKT